MRSYRSQWFIMWVVTILTLLLICDTLASSDDPIVNSASGSILGKFVERDINNFYAFHRIPYAQPPVGDLRFKPPQPIKPWTSILDAREEGPACMQRQPTFPVSEDCLTLSVYMTDLNPRRRRPVLFWVHGGAYETGHGRMELYGPDYFMKEDIIVVVIQFRLDILGHLNLGIKEAPGNVGLMDVVQALRWVKQNIEYFNGDPEEITVSGHSSGAITIHSLLLSPMTTGLFHRAIMQSGNTLGYRFFSDNHTVALEKLADEINFDINHPHDMLNYLKDLDATELLAIALSIKSSYPTGYAAYHAFSMNIDQRYEGQETFLPEHPLDILKSGRHHKVSILSGFTSDEGIRLEPYIDRLDYVNDNFDMIIPTDLFGIDDVSKDKKVLAARIKKFYFGEEDLSIATFQQYAEMCRDSWYVHITDYWLRLNEYLGNNEPVYYYEFAHDGELNYVKLGSGLKSPGVTHGDELGYLFDSNTVRSFGEIGAESKLTRKRLVNMWANFVKYGNPTPEITELLPIKWLPVDYPVMNILRIDKELSMHANLHRETTIFWQEIYGFDII